MTYQLLKYLPKDIINYGIVPFLMPNKGEIITNFKLVLYQLLDFNGGDSITRFLLFGKQKCFEMTNKRTYIICKNCYKCASFSGHYGLEQFQEYQICFDCGSRLWRYNIGTDKGDPIKRKYLNKTSLRRRWRGLTNNFNK